MKTPDRHVQAAEIADEFIVNSENLVGPEDRDPLRVVLEIAFETLAFLDAKSNDAEARQSMQGTLFSGLERINNLCLTWQMVAHMHDPDRAKEFPADPAVVREDLAKMWEAVPQGAASLATPHYLRDKGAGADTFPTDLDDLHRRLGEALRSVRTGHCPSQPGWVPCTSSRAFTSFYWARPFGERSFLRG